MGLLDRAQVLDDNSGNPGRQGHGREAEQLVAGFRHAAEQLDYPVEVFRCYKKLLKFTKGSLLFPDREKAEYYPWIATGLDRTTTRRMRIPFTFPPLHSISCGSLLTVSGEELTPMLSNRESGLTGPVHLTALGNRNKPDGLILALDADVSRPDDLALALEILNESLGINIIRSRKILEDVGTDDPVDPVDWLESWGEREACLVTLDATGAIESLMDAIEGLEIYRARRDVIGLIRRINGRMGRTYDLKDGRVLILFPADRMPDRELYLHQLSSSFCASILDLPEAPEFPVEFRRWPDEKEDVKASLSGFFRE